MFFHTSTVYYTYVNKILAIFKRLKVGGHSCAQNVSNKKREKTLEMWEAVLWIRDVLSRIWIPKFLIPDPRSCE
jgi:hypothetical protein